MSNRDQIYTASFRFKGDAPRIGADATWLGGKIIAVAFDDLFKQVEGMEQRIEKLETLCRQYGVPEPAIEGTKS